MSTSPSFSTFLLCLATATATTGCGDDGGPDAPDADASTVTIFGDWTLASISLEGTTYSRGDTAGVAGRMSIAPTQMHVELIKLMAGEPIGSVDAMTFALEVDGDTLLASGGDATYAFRAALAGDHLSLTFAPDDPRTTDTDAPPIIELDRAPALLGRLPGTYRALSMLANGQRITTETCLALNPPRGSAVAVRYEIELDVSPRLLLDVRQGATYYTDAACATSGTPMTGVATALIEDDGNDVTLYVQPPQSEAAGDVETYRVAPGPAETIVWTRVGCPACEGPQELVLERR